MSCSNGVCSPTATDAVLNVNDLENLLAAGNVEVTTTGTGVEANDIAVSTALSWSANSLALAAYRFMTIGATIADNGAGGIGLKATDPGHINYVGGNITFAELSSSLTIDGQSYLLANSIQSLAADIASAPAGRFALANGYDASGDGTYTSNPIPKIFGGVFDGLGNAISNLSINDPSDSVKEGLFYELAREGRISNVALTNANVSAVGGSLTSAGLLVGDNEGTVSRCAVSGEVIAEDYAGGLAAFSGTIDNSSSSATVQSNFIGGGLVGASGGKIHTSYATGSVTGVVDAGGLVGVASYGTIIESSHATGPVSLSGRAGYGGGLVGENAGWLLKSYATGSVTAGTNGIAGGLVGGDTGRIIGSFANGNVKGSFTSTVSAFAGAEVGSTDNSYATGAVSGGNYSYIGGFVGCIGSCADGMGGTIRRSYSIGRVPKLKPSYTGGFAGIDETAGGISNAYWDMTTSGRKRGTGNRGNEPGLRGTTTQQLQAGLPRGFSAEIWAEDPNINGGLPYLIANPPPQ